MGVRNQLTAAIAILTWVAIVSGMTVRAAERPGQFGPNSASQTRVGTIGQENSRYTLLDEFGTVKAYLYGRNSLNLSQFVGREALLRVRAQPSSTGDTPRLWVDSVKPSVATASYQTEPTRKSLTDQWPTTQAQFAEPTAVYDSVINPICGPPEVFWFDAQYLLWWARGMNIPPLVTTSPAGTSRDDAGVLGAPGTSILLGDQEILTQSRNGLRLRSGIWFDQQNMIGIEGDLFWLDDETFSFLAGCDGSGSPILARPFFNVNPRNPFSLAFDPPARQDAQLVCYPNELAGSVGVSASTRFYGGGLALRANLACDPLGPDSTASYSRVDLLAGYRYMYLRDQLLITENLTTLDTPSPIGFDIFDSFNTRNEFHGLDLGMVWRASWDRWWFEFLLRTAVGRTHQVVDIQGVTRISGQGMSNDYAGGLLTQNSNIGSFARNRLAFVPELGVTFGYQVWRSWHLTVGYSLIHWSAVVRSGDQIDMAVNPDQLAPPINPMAGVARPAFAFDESSFWAQGLTFGLQGRW